MNLQSKFGSSSEQVIYLHICISVCLVTVIQYAKQKHPRCKKSKAKSEAPVSSYSYTLLKV